MPKLYLGPGLSNRVHQALRRRLERFMAANAEASGHAGAPDLPMAENPPLSVNLDGTETEGDKGDDQVSQPPPPGDFSKSPMEKEDEDRSRSPRMRSPEVSDKELLSSTTALAVGMFTVLVQ